MWSQRRDASLLLGPVMGSLHGFKIRLALYQDVRNEGSFSPEWNERNPILRCPRENGGEVECGSYYRQIACSSSILPLLILVLLLLKLFLKQYLHYQLVAQQFSFCAAYLFPTFHFTKFWSESFLCLFLHLKKSEDSFHLSKYRKVSNKFHVYQEPQRSLKRKHGHAKCSVRGLNCWKRARLVLLGCDFPFFNLYWAGLLPYWLWLTRSLLRAPLTSLFLKL